jgi:hypothetical protein
MEEKSSLNSFVAESIRERIIKPETKKNGTAFGKRRKFRFVGVV